MDEIRTKINRHMDAIREELPKVLESLEHLESEKLCEQVADQNYKLTRQFERYNYHVDKYIVNRQLREVILPELDAFSMHALCTVDDLYACVARMFIWDDSELEGRVGRFKEHVINEITVLESAIHDLRHRLKHLLEGGIW